MVVSPHAPLVVDVADAQLGIRSRSESPRTRLASPRQYLQATKLALNFPQSLESQLSVGSRKDLGIHCAPGRVARRRSLSFSSDAVARLGWVPLERNVLREAQASASVKDNVPADIADKSPGARKPESVDVTRSIITKRGNWIEQLVDTCVLCCFSIRDEPNQPTATEPRQPENPPVSTAASACEPKHCSPYTRFQGSPIRAGILAGPSPLLSTCDPCRTARDLRGPSR
jgi:hypothetical protein